MAHIASCIATPESGFGSKPGSPAPSFLSSTPPATSADKPFTWRMLQSEPQRKYQLFPRERQATTPTGGKALDPEKAFAHAMNSQADQNEKQSSNTNLRLRMSQQNLIRRRKISVPELGPMTTVQENPMDSPTIPGRPPLHERSVSAPEDRGQRSGTLPKSASALRTICNDGDDIVRIIEEALVADSPRMSGPHSPRYLTPLVIPKNISQTPQMMKPRSNYTHIRPDSTPPMEIPRSARVDGSPMSRGRWTPSSSTPDLTYPRSASTDAATMSTLPTPISAPIMEAYRASPRPWEGHNNSDRAMTPDSLRSTHMMYGHRRGGSESSSIMDRGRPRKRSEGRGAATSPKTGEAKRSKSMERKAFEELPKGFKPSEAVNKMNPIDLETLQRQAFGQAERFEVLQPQQVEALSKELRQLDERTEYLRRTYTSLRAGRRNLHSRICQYLRSPRVARFSHESMLKQEEALAELDCSIDDWVIKLEQAENRRTRVRQKLLEHVAGAAILPITGNGSIDNANDSFEQAMVLQSPIPQDLSTPPRSPTRSVCESPRAGSTSPSPQRVVAQVPSTILEQPLKEEAAEQGKESRATSIMTTLSRSDVQSIRIYAGDDVYALLADVENEISKMSGNEPEPPVPAIPDSHLEPSRKEHERQKSHERLQGRTEDSLSASDLPTTTYSPPTAAGNAPQPSTPNTFNIPRKEVKAVTTPAPIKAAPQEILLTSAVFKP